MKVGLIIKTCMYFYSLANSTVVSWIPSTFLRTILVVSQYHYFATSVLPEKESNRHGCLVSLICETWKAKLLSSVADAGIFESTRSSCKAFDVVLFPLGFLPQFPSWKAFHIVFSLSDWSLNLLDSVSAIYDPLFISPSFRNYVRTWYAQTSPSHLWTTPMQYSKIGP